MRRCLSFTAAAAVALFAACGRGTDDPSADPAGAASVGAAGASEVADDLNKLSTYDRVPPAPPTVAAVTVRPRAVSLTTRNGGEQIIEGTLIKGAGPAPETVWVWAYYLAPSFNNGSWSGEAIPVAKPFAHGDTARFVARGSAHWMTNPYSAKGGYYARVSASAVSAEAAQVPTADRIYGASTRSA